VVANNPVMHRITYLILFVFVNLNFLLSQHSEFILYAPGYNPAIVIDSNEAEIIKLSAGLLAEDIERITGYKAPIINQVTACFSPLIIVGTLNSGIIRQLNDKQLINTGRIRNRWEVFSHSFISFPGAGQVALVISGSDNRGTAYGIFQLSEIMGVSPWYWWNDIPPVKKESLLIPRNSFISKEPSVKYRGIFLNDEDWGLHPWASKTFEPETGDIGPKTYARIFELLLRLKANTIWPAMHNCTKAFFRYPGNPEMARKYNIVIGSSHAEPMLRNNVDEWIVDSMGDFNYKTNQETVYRYWEQRTVQSKSNEAIYTIGMRGIHDSGIEGYQDQQSQKTALEKIIEDQRQILQNYINADIAKVPQVFVPYKEVLDIYDAGLQLPDDACIMWTDDNYGYIRRFNSEKESDRTGGSGLYYHISYWGRPHDYLWLSSTHPLLIWEELFKAWQTGIEKIWIVNAGDIKPGEYNTQLFLDMAYNMEEFTGTAEVRKHLSLYLEKIFGIYSEPIAAALWEYYRLAFERRPEFMGWSLTEPSTPTKRTAYNHFYYGDEAQKRIDAFSALENRVKEIRDLISPDRADAYFQLVYYPIVCTSYMNKKFLFADKAFYYGNLQNRLSADDYALWSGQAYAGIQEETQYYNHDLAGGKWDGMMNSAPRNLSVFQKPDIRINRHKTTASWNCIPEGYVCEDSCLFKDVDNVPELPVFTPSGQQKRFIDIFLTSETEIQWEAVASDKWITISDASGMLDTTIGNKEKRIWISIDWIMLQGRPNIKGTVTVRVSGINKTVSVTAITYRDEKMNCFAESNGLVSMFAENYSRMTGSASMYWKKIEGLGHAGSSLVSLPYSHDASVSQESGYDSNVLEYDFCSYSNAPCSVIINCLPVHPLNSDNKLRLAVSLDNSPPVVADYTTFGRSEEWKQNVLSNSARRSVPFQILKPGLHTLKIKALDPGVVLDHIIIDLGGHVDQYGIIDETRSVNGIR
jgi:hypothetical protein